MLRFKGETLQSLRASVPVQSADRPVHPARLLGCAGMWQALFVPRLAVTPHPTAIPPLAFMDARMSRELGHTQAFELCDQILTLPD